MTRAELRYAWGMFRLRMRYIGRLLVRGEFRKAWRIVRGPTYIMPVDHEPTPAEVRVNEHLRHQRQFLPPEQRRELQRTLCALSQVQIEDGAISEWQEMLARCGDDLPAGMYNYEVEDGRRSMGGSESAAEPGVGGRRDVGTYPGWPDGPNLYRPIRRAEGGNYG